MSENLQTDSSLSSDDSEYTKKKKKSHIRATIPRQRDRENAKMSPLTLRRRFMPRANIRHPAAHPAAAPAPAKAQKKPHPAPLESKEKTETPATSNRNGIKLTPFKKGFEMDTEKELAQAFNRPPRLFKEDNPFYPWLPRPTPIVNFHLNYKF